MVALVLLVDCLYTRGMEEWSKCLQFEKMAQTAQRVTAQSLPTDRD
jgi:hypothetical protein